MEIRLDRFRVIAVHALAEITPPVDENHPTQWSGYQLDFEEFPTPDLVRFALTRLRDIKALGPGEKVAWSIDACFGDVPFQIAYRKFGFQLVVPKGTPEEIAQRLILCLKKAARLAARSLEEVAHQQIDSGNVSIDNKYRIFDGAYQFFRQEASARFQENPNSGFGVVFAPKFAEAGYCAGAMVNAYFSRLEHLLVLALPFTDFDPGNGALRKFAEALWDDKFTTVFDLSTDEVAKRTRDMLGKIKKQFRNPISHGGFDKKGTAFHFHVPGIAAVPALLSNYKVSIERFVTSITKPEFETLCAELDDCDRLLESTKLGPGIRFAQRLLPVSFSETQRMKYRNVAEHPERFEAFLEHETDILDMHMNMDY
jgi:hypothetical protein